MPSPTNKSLLLGKLIPVWLINLIVQIYELWFDSALQARNAADMCLSAKAGELDALLPYHVPFTLVSGDRAIAELAIRFAKRTMRVISPHGKSDDQLYQLLITATTM